MLTPTPVAGRCAVSIDKAPTTIGSAGGAGSLTVRTDRECHWSITGQPEWVKFTSPAAGQGPAEISYLVDANRSTSQRAIELSVLGERVVIAQEAARCAYAVSPRTLTASAAGEEMRVQLSTEDFCAWTATAVDDWIDVISTDEGRGSAEIRLRIRPNNGGRRSGSVDVAGVSVDVAQRAAPPGSAPTPGPPAPGPQPSPAVPSPASPPPAVPPVVPPVVPAPQCAYSVDRDSVLLSREAQKFRITLTTSSGCPVLATAPASWLEVKSYPRTGAGTVQIEAKKNGDSRTRTSVVVLAGRDYLETITVSQAGRPQSDGEDEDDD